MTDDWTEPIDDTEPDSDPGDAALDADEPPEDDPAADHAPVVED